MTVIVKIAPVVAANWEDIGYRLKIEPHEIDTIRVEEHGDFKMASKKMLRKWLTSTKGKIPKTWRTFVETLLDIDIDPTSVIEVLKKEPVQN